MDTTAESFEAEASTFTEATFCERGSIGEAIGHTTVERESVDDTVRRLEVTRRLAHEQADRIAGAAGMAPEVIDRMGETFRAAYARSVTS